MAPISSVSSPRPAVVEALARKAAGAGVLSPAGLKALTDGHISGPDMLMARRLVATAMEKVNAAGADSNHYKPLEREFGRYQLARRLADETTKVYLDENPSIGGQLAVTLGRLTDGAFEGMNGWMLESRRRRLASPTP